LFQNGAEGIPGDIFYTIEEADAVQGSAITEIPSPSKRTRRKPKKKISEDYLELEDLVTG